MTEEGLRALQAELDQLETVGRQEIAKQIKTAREWGDLKENAEYHAAKDAQAHLETRILQIRERVDNATVVEKQEGGDVVAFGATVEVEDQAGEASTWQIVGEDEADIKEGRISVSSPIARALIGKEAGESVEVETPGGLKRYEIVDVRYE